MKIRKANSADINAVEKIYNEIHDFNETKEPNGWVRGVYPTVDHAKKAQRADTLFVAENDEGKIIGCAIIDHVQFDSYRQANWTIEAPDNKVMVLHTLCISPAFFGHGAGTRFVRFYEDYAKLNNCTVLRMDTNRVNKRARYMYRALGYHEAGIVNCEFNGIKDVNLVMLEKRV